jgi:hypothetical protein
MLRKENTMKSLLILAALAIATLIIIPTAQAYSLTDLNANAAPFSVQLVRHGGHFGGHWGGYGFNRGYRGYRGHGYYSYPGYYGYSYYPGYYSSYYPSTVCYWDDGVQYCS